MEQKDQKSAKMQTKCEKCDANAKCECDAKAVRCDGLGQKCECEKLFALPSLEIAETKALDPLKS